MGIDAFFHPSSEAHAKSSSEYKEAVCARTPCESERKHPHFTFSHSQRVCQDALMWHEGTANGLKGEQRRLSAQNKPAEEALRCALAWGTALTLCPLREVGNCLCVGGCDWVIPWLT